MIPILPNTGVNPIPILQHYTGVNDTDITTLNHILISTGVNDTDITTLHHILIARVSMIPISQHYITS